MIYYMRGGTCWRPEVKNMTIMVNSIFNGWRSGGGCLAGPVESSGRYEIASP